MLFAIETTDGLVRVIPKRPRLAVRELEALYRSTRRFLAAPTTKGVTLDLHEVEHVTTALVEMLRALALEARILRKQFRVAGALEALRLVLAAKSHRLSWAHGILETGASPRPGSQPGRTPDDRPTR